MVARAGGKTRAADLARFEYKKEVKDIVSNYNYLGLILTSSAIGYPATEGRIKTARIAANAALSILANTKNYAWEAVVKMFHAVAVSTLLYRIPV